MDSTDDRPELEFLRTTPEKLISRPPLASSLQHLESSYFLIALGRYPHALVTCASALESAMKSSLGIPPEDRINATDLYKEAINHYPALSVWGALDLKDFRDTRNRIVHYGYSPRDDETTAVLLLKTGYPFLIDCYKEFFGFNLLDGLLPEVGEQFRIAWDVYAKARDIPDLHLTYCFRAFRHLIRWGVRQSLMADWESDASTHAEEVGTKFERIEKVKGELERLFGASWDFNCPICRDIETFVCELDEDRLDDQVVSLTRGACPSCDLVVPIGCPFLVDELCRDQVGVKRAEILRDFGVLNA